MRHAALCTAVVLIAACGADSTQAPGRSGRSEDWPVYGHDGGGTRFSPLRDINRDTVSKLSVAWVAHTGETVAGPSRRRVGFESTPIVVDGALYLTTGTTRIIALNARHGREAVGIRSQNRSHSRLR